MFNHWKPRDPNRIDNILKLLEEAWKIEPDLRLGQLISILAYSEKRESFYMEDNLLEKALIKFIEENK